MSRSQSRPAWAIHAQSLAGHGYIGVYYLSEWRDRPLPVHLAGNTTALFRTRKAAREALERIKGPEWGFKHARVYRVMVTIEGEPA